MPEELFQIFWDEPGCNSEHTLSIKAAIRTENVTVGIESQKVPKALNGNNGSWNRILFRDNCLEKHLEGVPGTPAEFGEEFSIIEKVSPEDFWYAEDEVAVGNGLEDLLTEPFSKLQHSLLVA